MTGLSGAVLAAPEPGKAAPLGLLVVLLLGVVVYFLARSMGKHLKRVPASFDPSEEEREPDPVDRDDSDRA